MATEESKAVQAEALTVKGHDSESWLALLTPMQAAFCRQYADTGNGTQSALAAGYSRNTAPVVASRMLKDPRISGAIERLRLEATHEGDITDKTVLEGLLAEANNNRKGASSAARVSAWRELASIKGMHRSPDLGAWQGISELRIVVVLGPEDHRLLPV